VLWSFIPIVSKLAQNNLDNYQFLFYSSVFSFLSILIISIYKKSFAEVFTYKLKDYLYIAFVGFLGTYLYYILLYYGYNNANGLEVLIIQYTWPILIVLFSMLFFKEKITMLKLLSLALGFMAVVLVLSKGNIFEISFSNINILFYVFIGAGSFALFSILGSKISLNSTNTVLLYFLTASVFSFFTMMIFSNIIIPSFDDLLYIIINGIFINGITYILWINALKLEKSSYVAPFAFITPILSLILLVIFFDEEFLFVYIMALALIIISALLNIKKEKENV